MTIVSTHIQRDELGGIPDFKKRTTLLAIPTTYIATNGAVWGVSKWGEAKYGNKPIYNMIDDLKIGNSKHTADALIGATMAGQVDWFFTEDQSFAKRIARVLPDPESGIMQDAHRALVSHV